MSPKKKKKAANTLSPNEARARECDLARRMARWITKANDYWRRAANAEPDSNEQRVATGTAENFSHMVGFWITNIDNPAKILHLVADALDGKRLGAKFDDALLEAFEKAMRSPTRGAQRSMNLLPLSSEVDDKLSVVLTKMGYKKKAPTRDAQLRRLKVLGHTPSKKLPRKHP